LPHPREFLNNYRIGRDQFFVFLATIIGVLATDLLLGVLIGIGLKVGLYLANGVRPSSIFRLFVEIEPLDEKHTLIRVHGAAVFSNWIAMLRQLERLGISQRRNITIDLSKPPMIDHSTIEKLHEMELRFAGEGLVLTITGLENLSSWSVHPKSTRVRRS
jgi:MFS superfamily sulfate permease-like transporter